MPFRDTLLVVSSRYNIPTRDDRTVNDRYKHFRKMFIFLWSPSAHLAVP